MKSLYLYGDTPRIAQELLEEIRHISKKTGAVIVGLEGELGAGKTTLVQALAKELGIEEHITSPTFVIAKFYTIHKKELFNNCIHIDAYRIEDEKELQAIGFDELTHQEGTLILIEWPSKIKETLKRYSAQYYSISHTGDIRTIEGPFQYE